MSVVLESVSIVLCDYCTNLQLEAIFDDKPKILTLSEIEDQLRQTPPSQDHQQTQASEAVPPPPPSGGPLPQALASLLQRDHPRPDVMGTSSTVSAGPRPHAPPPGFYRAPPMPRGVLRSE